MEYRIQPGDTITSVTDRLGTDWNSLKNANPAAVGKSAKTGQWIVKAGKTVSMPSPFQEILAQQIAKPLESRPIAKPALKTTSHQQPTISQANAVPSLRKGKTLWGQTSKQSKVDRAATRLDKNRNPDTLQNDPQIRNQAKKRGRLNTATYEVVASWYGKNHQGRAMANGAPFDMNGATIAHRDIAFGTVVELENPKTGAKVKAMVTDRGPSRLDRDVDLSYGLAKRLSLARQGVGNLKMRVL